jgi:hypothetical protein
LEVIYSTLCTFCRARGDVLRLQRKRVEKVKMEREKMKIRKSSYLPSITERSRKGDKEGHRRTNRGETERELG